MFDKELDLVTRDLLMRADYCCEAMIPQICRGDRFLERHHRRSRRIRADGKANQLSNLLLVCRNCHELIHREKRWAREYGFVISANADPDLVHVNRAGLSLESRQGNR